MKNAVILPAVRLGSYRVRRGDPVRLEFAMVWSSASAPAVHVDHGMKWAIIDVLSARATHSCLGREQTRFAEDWVAFRRASLLRRWADIGAGIRVFRRRNSPQVSRFAGMKVEMYWSDHARPHVHVRHAGEVAVVDVRSGEVIHGRIARGPKRVLLGWIRDHQGELLRAWDLAARNQPFPPIEPPERGT